MRLHDRIASLTFSSKNSRGVSACLETALEISRENMIILRFAGAWPAMCWDFPAKLIWLQGKVACEANDPNFYPSCHRQVLFEVQEDGQRDDDHIHGRFQVYLGGKVEEYHGGTVLDPAQCVSLWLGYPCWDYLQGKSKGNTAIWKSVLTQCRIPL